MDRIKISVVEHWIVECYNSSERIMKCNDKMKDSGRHKKKKKTTHYPHYVFAFVIET